MMRWKVLKVIGILFLILTVFVDVMTVIKKLQTLEELITSFKTIYSAIGYYSGYIVGIIITFIPSVLLIWYSNKKLKEKVEADLKPA